MIDRVNKLLYGMSGGRNNNNNNIKTKIFNGQIDNNSNWLQ